MIREIIQLLGPAIRTGPLYQIHRMNLEPGRQNYMNVLNADANLIGMIISQPTGKCIGIIDRQGRIKHCDGKDAASPYTVIMKSSVIDNDKPAQRYSQSKERVVGQCVDAKGSTVAEFVRKNRKNSIRPATSSTAPVMAIVVPVPSQGPIAQPQPSPSIEYLIQESKDLIDKSKAPKL